MVACGARLTGEPPVRIGLPLDGWDLAVVDEAGQPVGEGEIGELIIGGVGLARYLDPAKDAEKYAPMPTLGWDRAYRSGDLVRYEPRGPGVPGPRRRPGQARRPPDRARRDRQRAAGAARRRRRGGGGTQHRRPATRSSSGTSRPAPGFDPAAAADRLREILPAALVPAARAWSTRCRPGPPARSTGTRCRGRWPTRAPDRPAVGARRHRGVGRGACGWRSSAPTSRPTDDDFFDLGGGSLTAAQLVSAAARRASPRSPSPTSTSTRRSAASPATLRRDGRAREPGRTGRCAPTPAQDAGRPAAAHASRCAPLTGLRWLTWVAAGNNLAAALFGARLGCPRVSWWWVVLGWLVLVSPAGPDGARRARRPAAAARASARATYPRGGRVHLRLWLAERLADELGCRRTWPARRG